MVDMEFEKKLQSMEIKALADIAINGDNLRLFSSKLIALATVKGRCSKYREHGFSSELVLAVLEKKLELIKKASTVKECETIQQPSAPQYHKYPGKFETDDTWVAEEELIQWTLASLRAPLPPIAIKRYLDLSQQVLGINIEEIMRV